jgi:glycosyltransferase involved in cell wall biosynthesis
MRIAFDGTTLRPGRTGVGYYTEHLLHHLLEIADEDEVVIVSNGPVDTNYLLPSRARVVSAGWGAPGMVWMQTVAPRLLRQLQPDVVHFTNGMMPLVPSVPTVVTIHDMSLTLFPRYHPLRRVILNRPLVNLAAKRADAVITVSDSAKRDIVGLYGLAADRVRVVHEAPATSFRPVHDAAVLQRVRRTYGLADRFILYVGTIEPRKNLPTLIDAFGARHRSGDLPHQLVCVGPYGWLCRDIETRVERLGISGAVRFTGYVPFVDLPAIYSLAEMFVFPSLYEGFGLPVVEAMACGTAVVAGSAEALSEVAGGAVEHVRSLDVAALGDTLVALGRDADRRLELVRRGQERARAFSWERAARETLEVYRLAAGVSQERGRGAIVNRVEPGAATSPPAEAWPAAARRARQG